MTRIRSSATRDSSRTSSRSAAALSLVDMKVGLVSATAFSASSMRPVAAMIG
jgi:hypothetical protein